jgi:anti-anti-sigma factor
MLRVECSRNGGIDIVRVEGDLDVNTVDLFENPVREIIDRGGRAILIDAAAMDFIDSGALGRIVAILKDLRPLGGRMAAANLKAHIRGTIQLIRLDRFLRIFNSVEAAVQDLSAP